MIALDQRFKDLYNTYGGKHVRLVFYKKEYHAPYPSSDLVPSYQLYPSRAESDVVDFVIGDNMIHADTMEITESLCSNEDLEFGACEAAKLEIVISGSQHVLDLVGREFALVESFFGLDEMYPHDGLYPSSGLYPSKDIVRGVFTVDSVPKEDDRDTRRIIAYDRMERLNQDVSEWYESLSFPISLKRFRAGLCSYAGIPEVPASLVNDDLVIEKTLDTEVLNGRDLIRYVCQINGVFGNINHSGQFRYVSIPKKNKITDTITRYKSVDSEEYVVPDIDGVKIRQEEGDIGGFSQKDGDNFYIIEGNILVFGKTTEQLNEISRKVKAAVSELEYRPATIVGNGAPWYEMGDRILVRTSDGDVNTIIMQRTSSGIQGPTDTIEATGSQKLTQPFNIDSQIIQAKGLVAKLKFTVEEVSSELINFEEQTSTKFLQTAERIELEAKRAKNAEEELSSRITITAESITSEVNKLIKATDERLSSRITQTAEQISAEVTRATQAEGTLSSRITQTATEIRSEVEEVESGLSSRITQTATEIRSEVSDTARGLSNRITQTDSRLTATIRDQSLTNELLSTNLEMTASGLDLEIKKTEDMSLKLTATAEKLETKVTKGEVSSSISQESDKITLSANRLIVNSTNFKLDGNGNAEFSGRVTGGTISIVGSAFKFECDSHGVKIGGFIINDEYGRNIFMSEDETNGMSTDDTESGKYYLWAGYGYGSYGIDSLFLVNSTQVRATHNFFLHGPKGTINVYDAIKALQSGCITYSTSCTGDSCTGDCPDDTIEGCDRECAIDAGSCTCFNTYSCTCDGDIGCPYDGCVGYTCGPGIVG